MSKTSLSITDTVMIDHTNNFFQDLNQQKKIKKAAVQNLVVDVNNNFVKDNANNVNTKRPINTDLSYCEDIASIKDAINPQDMSNQSSIEQIDRISHSSRNSDAKTSIVECGEFE